uniref:Skp1_POZ domain-containing protein n=1 Tax=Rhabditophanes sp. KR3021 TaxID=114890 RepID=A0AC35UEJ6_9BILA
MKLETSDGKTFEVTAEVLEYMKTCQHMIELLNADQSISVPLPNVCSDILGNLLEWIYRDLKEVNQGLEMTPWQQELYSSWSREHLFRFMNAASYLEIDPIIKSTTKFVALQLSKFGNHGTGMRAYLGIENDMTAEDVKKYDGITGMKD